MKIYLSHPIRGKYGANATNTQMKENCNRAIDIANYIRANIPSLEVYVPGEHEDFVGITYKKKFLTEQQILNVDCEIINSCDGVIIYIPESDTLQGGRLVEATHAKANKIPVWEFEDVRVITGILANFILRA